MNYIEQINGFWKTHDNEVFSTTCVALYFHLLDVNNKCGWSKFFKRNNAKICADLDISKPTLTNARIYLKDAGLIEFETQNGNANVTYTLKDFLQVTKKVTTKVSIEVVDEVSSQVSTEVPIEESSRLLHSKDKHKQKAKTKTKITNSVAKAPGDLKFWKELVDIWFVVYENTTGSKPTFPAAQAKNLKNIVLQLEKVYKEFNQVESWTEDQAKMTLNHFLKKALADKWIRDNFLLTNIWSKFDVILNQSKKDPGAKDSKINKNRGNDGN